MTESDANKKLMTELLSILHVNRAVLDEKGLNAYKYLRQQGYHKFDYDERTKTVFINDLISSPDGLDDNDCYHNQCTLYKTRVLDHQGSPIYSKKVILMSDDLNFADFSASEIIAAAKQRYSDEYMPNPLFENQAYTEHPELIAPSNETHPATDVFIITSRDEVESPLLKSAVEKNPISIIRGLVEVCGIDTSKFSTKSAIKANKDLKIEERWQNYGEDDRSWNCDSTEAACETVLEFTKYQSDTFKKTISHVSRKTRKISDDVSKNDEGAGTSRNTEKQRLNNSPYGRVYFGTNANLTVTRWHKQLNELKKLPSFLRHDSYLNGLSRINKKIDGVNTVQLYMTVPGAKITAHQERDHLTLVNFNVGPGSMEWYCVPHDYWGDVKRMCQERNVDFYGTFWPTVKELIDAGIPIYKCIQKPGDVIYINPGCVHWAKASSWNNFVSWNVFPITQNQIQTALQAHKFYATNGKHSLIPMEHTMWTTAIRETFTSAETFRLVRQAVICSLNHSVYVHELAKEWNKKVLQKPYGHSFKVYQCCICSTEIFNDLFYQCNQLYCVYCAVRSGLEQFKYYEQVDVATLGKILDGMKLVE